jgi:hypothetical protein
MARIQFVTLEKATDIEPPAGGRGKIISHAYFNKPADPLRLCLYELIGEAALNIARAAIDTLVYVWTGAVQVQGVRLAQRSSLIIEQGASAEISAVDADVSLLVFSPKQRRQPAALNPQIHLLPKERVPCNWDLSSQGSAGGALHADATDSSCRLWMHENDFYIGGSPVAVHSHSEDEIIFVREGELCVGMRRYGPGSALSIAANAKYGFTVGPKGLSFVNFRGAAPTYTSHDGKISMDEAVFWRSQTGAPQYIDLPAG